MTYRVYCILLIQVTRYQSKIPADLQKNAEIGSMTHRVYCILLIQVTRYQRRKKILRIKEKNAEIVSMIYDVHCILLTQVTRCQIKFPRIHKKWFQWFTVCIVFTPKYHITNSIRFQVPRNPYAIDATTYLVHCNLLTRTTSRTLHTSTTSRTQYARAFKQKQDGVIY